MTSKEAYAPPPSYADSQEKQPLSSSIYDIDDLEAQWAEPQSDGVPQYVRNDFLKKVYAILSVQLLVTTIVAGYILTTPSVRDFVMHSSGMMMLCFVGTLICIIAMHCVKDQYPLNLALLAVFTLLESYSIGAICCMYKTESVVMAAGITLTITISLTIYAFTAKRDFSSWGAGLYSVLMCLLLGSIVQLFIPFSSALNALMSIGGAILFSCFIIYDTDQIAKRLSPDDYVIGAIELYLDIINLFVYILRIVGSSRD